MSKTRELQAFCEEIQRLEMDEHLVKACFLSDTGYEIICKVNTKFTTFIRKFPFSNKEDLKNSVKEMLKRQHVYQQRALSKKLNKIKNLFEKTLEFPAIGKIIHKNEWLDTFMEAVNDAVNISLPAKKSKGKRVLNPLALQVRYYSIEKMKKRFQYHFTLLKNKVEFGFFKGQDPATFIAQTGRVKIYLGRMPDYRKFLEKKLKVKSIVSAIEAAESSEVDMDIVGSKLNRIDLISGASLEETTPEKAAKMALLELWQNDRYIKMRQAEVPDFTAEVNMSESLDILEETILDILQVQGNAEEDLLVHCKAGIARSTLHLVPLLACLLGENGIDESILLRQRKAYSKIKEADSKKIQSHLTNNLLHPAVQNAIALVRLKREQSHLKPEKLMIANTMYIELMKRLSKRIEANEIYIGKGKKINIDRFTEFLQNINQFKQQYQLQVVDSQKKTKWLKKFQHKIKLDESYHPELTARQKKQKLLTNLIKNQIPHLFTFMELKRDATQHQFASIAELFKRILYSTDAAWYDQLSRWVHSIIKDVKNKKTTKISKEDRLLYLFKVELDLLLEGHPDVISKLPLYLRKTKPVAIENQNQSLPHSESISKLKKLLTPPNYKRYGSYAYYQESITANERNMDELRKVIDDINLLLEPRAKYSSQFLEKKEKKMENLYLFYKIHQHKSQPIKRLQLLKNIIQKDINKKMAEYDANQLNDRHLVWQLNKAAIFSAREDAFDELKKSKDSRLVFDIAKIIFASFKLNPNDDKGYQHPFIKRYEFLLSRPYPKERELLNKFKEEIEKNYAADQFNYLNNSILKRCQDLWIKTKYVKPEYIYLNDQFKKIAKLSISAEEKLQRAKEEMQYIYSSLQIESKLDCILQEFLEEGLGNTLDITKRPIKDKNYVRFYPLKIQPKRELKRRMADELENDIKADDINFEAVIENIENYIKKDGSHLGFFTKIFDGDRGKIRANTYLQLLRHAANTTEKMVILLALLRSPGANVLQTSVLNGLELAPHAKCDPAQHVYNMIVRYHPTQVAHLEKVAHNIIKLANNKKKYYQKDFGKLETTLRTLCPM